MRFLDRATRAVLFEDDVDGKVVMGFAAVTRSVPRVGSPGWRATIYRDKDYERESFEVTADVPNLHFVPGTCRSGGLNDCITAIRVRQQ